MRACAPLLAMLLECALAATPATAAEIFAFTGATVHPVSSEPLDDAVLGQLKSKYGYTSSVVPAGMFKGLEKDVVTIGFPTCLLVREDISSDVVYTLVKAIVENKEKIQSAYKSFKAFDPKTAWKPEKVGGVPLHPGAERYYKERGWK